MPQLKGSDIPDVHADRAFLHVTSLGPPPTEEGVTRQGPAREQSQPPRCTPPREKGLRLEDLGPGNLLPVKLRRESAPPLT